MDEKDKREDEWLQFHGKVVRKKDGEAILRSSEGVLLGMYEGDVSTVDGKIFVRLGAGTRRIPPDSFEARCEAAHAQLKRLKKQKRIRRHIRF